MFTATKEKEPRHDYERHDDEKTAAPAADNATQPADPANFVYPSGFKLALLLISIYIGMFLVALVREQGRDSPRSTSTYGTYKLTTFHCRINSSSRPRYPPSPTNFTQRMMSAGTARPTCCPTAPFCWHLENYTLSWTSKPLSWLRSYSSRLARPSAARRRVQSLSLLAGPLRAWELEAFSLASYVFFLFTKPMPNRQYFLSSLLTSWYIRSPSSSTLFRSRNGLYTRASLVLLMVSHQF